MGVRLPTESQKAADIAIAVVEDEDRFLVGQRPNGVPLAGCWEFPGGKVHAEETCADAAVRECREETGQLVRVAGRLLDLEYEYEYGALHLYFFDCRIVERRELHELFRWVPRRRLRQLEFPPANRQVLDLLCRGL